MGSAKGLQKETWELKKRAYSLVYTESHLWWGRDWGSLGCWGRREG